MRLAGKADWARLHEFVLRIGRTRGHIEARRDRGDLCFVALSEGRLVHFFWVATSPTWVPQIRATVEVRPGDAYGYDSFTDETVRGQAVQPVVTSVVLRYEQAHGFARHFFYADRHSPAALQILGKLGGVSWTLTRTVRSFQIAGAKAFLVIGLDSGGEPRLEPAANARRLGPFGYWSHEQP